MVGHSVPGVEPTTSTGERGRWALPVPVPSTQEVPTGAGRQSRGVFGWCPQGRMTAGTTRCGGGAGRRRQFLSGGSAPDADELDDEEEEAGAGATVRPCAACACACACAWACTCACACAAASDAALDSRE